MNASFDADRLDPQVRQQILEEKIIPQYLTGKTSFEHPKAIILGGQPGAGKGGLADAARDELHGDVVLIDPDEMRNFHSGVEKFRSEHPYSWSGHTQRDAGDFADGLRQAATDGRKNFIFDTTLSHGEWTAGLVKDLQAKGYDVDVRVVATAKMESELGVDKRFAGSLDAQGYGRHVPQGARDAIYDKVPASLDTIHTQTNAPIRVYNREGKELYDSRSDTRAPGQALEEAREARLHDPKITRSLNEGWKEQVRWHENLPDALTHNSKVMPETAQRLLAERSELSVVEGVQHQAAQAASLDYAERIHPTLIKGAGTVAVAIDTVHTTHQVLDLVQQGNITGGESQVMHFAARNLGMLAGAELVGGSVTLGSSETGPGALILGAGGAALGAIGGDKVMDLVDNYRINHQTDPQGRPWHLNPSHPEHGWQSELPPLPDVQRPIADAALSNRLDYQASSKAAELRMANPGELPDPYKQPIDAHDTHYMETSDWTRDPQSHAWSRSVVTGVVDRVVLRETETASPTRAAELNHSAEQTAVQNRTNSPQGIAETYQQYYQRNGWDKFGAMPEMVTNTLHDVDNKVLASDSHTYTRDQSGQWSTPGTIWGENTPKGNVRDELDTTYQHERPLHAAPAAAGPSAQVPRLDSPDHPGHTLFTQAQSRVRELDEKMGRASDARSDNLAGAATVAALSAGIMRIDHVLPNIKDGSTMFVAQNTSPLKTVAQLPTMQGMNTPLEQSSAQYQQVAQQQVQAQQQTQQQTQGQRQRQDQATTQQQQPAMQIQMKLPGQ